MDRTTLITVDTEREGEPHAYRMRITGEIDLESGSALAREFAKLADLGAMLVIIDAAGVDFIDSAGLREIVKAGNELGARGGQLFVEGVNGAAQRVLELTGLLERYRRPDNDG